jgi:deferrochelatase/peroxidase EfeB
MTPTPFVVIMLAIIAVLIAVMIAHAVDMWKRSRPAGVRKEHAMRLMFDFAVPTGITFTGSYDTLTIHCNAEDAAAVPALLRSIVDQFEQQLDRTFPIRSKETAAP